MNRMRFRWGFLGVILAAAMGLPYQAAELAILLPLQRTAYQTNELIDLSVVRSDDRPLNSGQLTLSLTGTDGTRMYSQFPASVVPLVAGSARKTELFRLNGWLLRPGKYTLAANADGATAQTEFELFTHLRRSSFKLINWGRAQATQQLVEGEDNLGFNLFYGGYANDDEANFIRAGVDFMACCVMSGAHQMDLRQECDWSDPYVIHGGTRRAVRRAFIDRTRPNVPGVHFYDEPGLTWGKDPETGLFTPHSVPWQLRSYEAALGRAPIRHNKVDPNTADDLARWKHWARWKLGIMDAAWKDAQFGVTFVRPDFLSATQSQYGFSAFTDGYYFNVTRSLPVISGHGGYHDFGPGYFNPSLFLEFARARDHAKPNWYLPTWYGNTTTDQFRLEQYLSFQTAVQGMMSPPDIDPFQPSAKPAAQGVVESNKLMGRLGTIFATMRPSRPPVAMLFSLSHNLHRQAKDRTFCYAHADDHLANLNFTYLAGKLLQQQFAVVLDEDVVDGTLAAEHKAVILVSLKYLPPEVVAALTSFAAHGGLVLSTTDCEVKIPGAVDLGMTPQFPDAEKVRPLLAAQKYAEAAPYTKLRNFLAAAQPMAEALRPHLAKAGIKPIFGCDQPGIVATRQDTGDVEYLFAVNATHDPQGDPQLGMKPVVANLALEADGRPVYDAVLGVPVAGLRQQGDALCGSFRFGPGQMRVFARTARPIGSVRVAAPTLQRDYTAAHDPLQLNFSAVVLDSQGGLLSGSLPLEICLADPAGATRYLLHRATDRGALMLSLPLALNDPPGPWKVIVRELLSGTEHSASFTLPNVSNGNAIVGAIQQAIFFGNDRQNIYRFARTHQKATIVRGSSDFCAPAAQRIENILRPWGIVCTTVQATDVNRPRVLSDDEARTWVGLDFAGSGQIKPGQGNPPAIAGFDVQGPVILVGNPDDNPLIAFLQKQRFLPYVPDKLSFPGPGRGMDAWQFDGIGVNQESVTLIAYDAEGMNEAVGSFYQAVAGLDPLTALVPPARCTFTPGTPQPAIPSATVAWQVNLPDRIVAIQANGDTIMALSRDGSLATLSGDGTIHTQTVVDSAQYDNKLRELLAAADLPNLADAQKRIGATRIVKLVTRLGNRSAVAYWGGTLEILNPDQNATQRTAFSQDVTAMTSADQLLLVGLADGRVLALVTK